MIRRLAFASSLVVGACVGTNKPVLTQSDAAPGADAPGTTADAPASAQTWILVNSVTSTDLYGVTGSSAIDVLAVGGTPGTTGGNSGVAVRWNGTNWSVTPNLVNLLAVSGETAVGEYGDEGSETYWNGLDWTAREVLGAGYLRGTWTTSPGSYAVGDNGLLSYTTETGIAGSWGTLSSNTTNALYAVWGSSPSDVYVVGAGGVILHNTNAGVGSTGTWVKTTKTSSTLTGVWGSSANDVYVVGEAPAVILHSTDGGASWSTTTPPSAVGLYGVGGRSANDVYAVGATGGVIFHSAGNDVWSPETTPTTKDLFGVWVASTGDAYAVGRGGTILHKAP
jgi:photosystem II stability/assembly factor-like uncharacterized protein